MPCEVYTCTEFPSRLPSILHRHPKAEALLLQLTPVATSSDTKQKASVPRAKLLTTPSKLGWMDDASDLITIYAVLLRRAGKAESSAPPSSYSDLSWAATDGDPCVESVCLVVGHASRITLKWCAQLQHTLSITSLLMTASHHGCEETSSFHEMLLGNSDSAAACGSSGCYAAFGVIALLVRLSPFVSPLQWDRYADGFLGSHHYVCASYRCVLVDKCEDDEDDNSEAARCSDEKERETTPDSLEAAAPAVAGGEEGDYRQLQRDGATPSQKRRCEHGVCTASASSPPLPFRIAAVLNGNAPLPQSPLLRGAMCVWCLAACDGCALTTSFCVAPAEFTPGTEPNALHFIFDFLADAVLPSVSLDVIGGTWARTESGELQRDVGSTGGGLGNSYAIRLPHRLDDTAEHKARSVTFVVDFSPLLLSELAGPAKKLSATCDKTTSKKRNFIAQQIAASIQETLGQLVSANIDMFSFSLHDKGRNADAAAADEAVPGDVSSSVSHFKSGSAQLTREVLYRSIAVSVSRIVSLSPNPEFKAEVVRLLWGTGAADTPASAGAKTAWTQPSAGAIQRRIEECLLSPFSE
ncbi:hypothetical protein ABL78_4714 [Leptomonas seymouri]|uniref:Uncharacterized protein n=1 Tax=Leptomonas seymouri TaxID=5684 RepID=A0A0N1PDW8_LEPSE|nr:hypothetical protein ABL78_4714 [Leptomonas seymouri]|eukprot:KPI86241.1 hypothetical protein ABL78_4714 [Leptomonas seymouri]